MLTHWSYVFLALTPRKSMRMISAGYRSNCELTKQSVPLWRVTCISGNNEHVIKRFNCTYKYILKVSHEYCSFITSFHPFLYDVILLHVVQLLTLERLVSTVIYRLKGTVFKHHHWNVLIPACIVLPSAAMGACPSIRPPISLSVFLCRGCCHSMNFLLVTYWSNDPVGLDWIQPDQTYQHQPSE